LRQERSGEGEREGEWQERKREREALYLPTLARGALSPLKVTTSKPILEPRPPDVLSRTSSV
jgi:hypothetical protein